MSLSRFALFAAAALFAVPASAAPKAPKAPSLTATSAALPAGSSLELTLKMDELAICDGAPCFLWIGESDKEDARFLFVEIGASGAFTASAENEHFSKDAKDDDENTLPCKDHTEATKTAAEEKKDEEKDEEKDEDDEATPDESWKEKPVLSVEQRRARQFDRKVRGKFCVEKASGTVAGEGNERTLSLASDVLPESSFVVYANGHFGVYAGEVQIGTPTKTGYAKYHR